MANYDAEIRVKTSLDNRSFKVEANKLKGSLEEIEKKAYGVKEQLESLEQSGVSKSSQKYKNVQKELLRWSEKLSKFVKGRDEAIRNMELNWDPSKGSIDDDANYQKLLSSWQEASERARVFQSQIGSYFDDSAEETEKAAEKIQENVKKIQEALSSTELPGSMNQMRADIEEYTNDLKLLEKEGKYFGDTDYDRLYKYWKDATDAVKEYQAQLNKQTEKGRAAEAEKIAKAKEKQEAVERRLEAQAERNRQRESRQVQRENEKQAKIQAQAAEEQRLAQIKANATVSDRKVVELLERKRQLVKEIADLEKAGVTAGYKEYDSRQAELGYIGNELSKSSDMGGTIASLGVAAGKVSKVAAIVMGVIAGIKKAAAIIGGVIKKISSKISRLVRGVVKGIRKAFTTIGSLSKKLFNRLTSGFKKSGSSTQGFTERLLGLVKSVFVFNVISRAFQSMVTGVQSSIKKFTQYSSSFNGSVSSLVNALETLKNAIAGAFAPIISVAIPYLVQLINYITSAVNMISQLIAALTGKSTWHKAVQQNKDYAASLDEISDSANKAAGSLAKFDDLDVLEQPDAGGAGGGGTGDVLWEEVPVSDSMKDLAEWFKEMWEDADFYELGKLLGEKLKEALDSIPWEEIKETARKIGKSIASFINGFIEVEGLGESIGKTLAEALNTAFEFLNAFVHELHWDSIGKFIAETFNGFFENIDWPLIYDTFVTGAKGLADAINAFANNFNWDVISNTISNIVNTFVDTVFAFFDGVEWDVLGTKVGQQISDSLNKINFTNMGMALSKGLISIFEFLLGVVDNIQWSQLGTRFATGINAIDWNGIFGTMFPLIVTAINGAIELIRKFLISINWEETMTALGAHLSAALSGFDWENAAKAFGAGVNALVDIVKGFLTGLDTSGIISGITTWFSNAIEVIDWADLGDTIELLVNGLLDAILQFISEVDWEKVGSKIGEMLSAIDWSLIKEKIRLALSSAMIAAGELVGSAISGNMFDIGKAIIEGINLGIGNSGGSLLTTILGFIIDMVTGTKEHLGIHSPSTVFQEIGQYLIEGLLLGIQEMWITLQEWFLTTFENLILFFSEKWTAIKEGAVEIWTLLKDNLSEIWTGIQEAVAEKFDAVKSKLEEVWEAIKTTIDLKVKSIKDKIDELLKKATDFKDEASKAFNTVKENIINALSPVIDKIKDFINWVRDAIQAVQDFFSSGYDQVGSSASKTSKGGGRSLLTADTAAARAAIDNLPHLASGSVIRGGSPFLAVLGDQRPGQTNVEAPLSTIRQAVREELSGLHYGGGQLKVTLNVNGSDLAQAVLQDFLSEMNRQGYDVEVLGVT